MTCFVEDLVLPGAASTVRRKGTHELYRGNLHPLICNKTCLFNETLSKTPKSLQVPYCQQRLAAPRSEIDAQLRDCSKKGAREQRAATNLCVIQTMHRG